MKNPLALAAAMMGMLGPSAPGDFWARRKPRAKTPAELKAAQKRKAQRAARKTQRRNQKHG